MNDAGVTNGEQSASTRGPTRAPTKVRVAVIAVIAMIVGALAYWAVSDFFTSGVSPCFSALPVARQAIHVKAKFVGVRRLTPKDLTEDFPQLIRRDPELGKKPACVVAYEGDFQPADVDNPRPRTRPGKIALVIVPHNSKTAFATLLRDRMPANFSQLFGRGLHR